MRPLSIEITGFRTYVDPTRIDFSPGCTFLLGSNLDIPDYANNNGSGKTTILEAIVWALFGKTSTKSSGKQLINHNLNRCKVKLSMGNWEEDPELVVVREIGAKETLTFSFNGENFSGDKEKVQRELLSKIGISFDTFCSTVFLGGGSRATQFLLSPPSERSKILSYLVDDTIFQEASKLIGADLKTLETEWEDLGMKIRLKQQDIAHHQSTLSLIQDSMKANQNAQTQRLEGIRAEIEIRKQKIRELEEEHRSLYSSTPEDLDSLRQSRIELADQLLTQRQNTDKMSAQAGMDPSRLVPGNLCASCGQVLEDRHVKEKQSHYDKFTRLRKISVQAENAIQLQISEVDSKISIRMSRTEQMKQIKRRIGDHQSDILLLTDDLKLNPFNMKELQEKERTTKEFLEKYFAELNELNAKEQVLPSRLKVLRDLYLAFSKDIKNLMFDLLRDSLEAHTEKFLRGLIGGQVKVTYPANSSAIREKFEILVYNNGHYQDLSDYSDGETWRVSFSILLALREVLCERSRVKLDFVMVDDPIGGLDDVGMAEFVKNLRLLGSSKECSLVLCTLPSDRMLDGADQTIKIVKQYGESKVVER